MYKWFFGSDVRFWNMISCCLNAFKVKRSFSSRVKVHELWEFFCTSGFPVKKERAEPRGLTGEKLADEGLLLLERETELLAATERDRASCCYWERQSFLLLLRVTEFFRRCWVRRSSCCCCRRGPEFLAESCWVRRRPPTRRGSESSAATGSG